MMMCISPRMNGAVWLYLAVKFYVSRLTVGWARVVHECGRAQVGAFAPGVAPISVNLG